MTSRPRLISYKAIIPFCLFSLFLFALPTRTQAGGHYEGPVYKYTITATDGAGNSQTFTSDDNDPDAGSGYGLNTTGGIGYDGYTGVSVQMDVTAKFTWTPDAETPDAPPPDQAYFRETGSAYAGDFFFCDSGSPEPPEAKDGLGDDPDVHTDDLSPYLFAYDYSSHGNHLKQKNGAEITFTHSLSAKLKGDYAAGSGGVFYSVASIPPPGYWTLTSTEFVNKYSNADAYSTVNFDDGNLFMSTSTTYAGTGSASSVVTGTARQHFHWSGEGPTTSTFSADYLMSVSGIATDVFVYNASASSDIQYQEGLLGTAPNGDPDDISFGYLKISPESGPGTKQVHCDADTFSAHEDALMALITGVSYTNPAIPPDPHDASYNPVTGSTQATARITFSNVRP